MIDYILSKTIILYAKNIYSQFFINIRIYRNNLYLKLQIFNIYFTKKYEVIKNLLKNKEKDKNEDKD
jgi:hypothetical protein